MVARAHRPDLVAAALEATRMLILVADPDGIVRAANQAVQDATGLSEEDLVRPIWELAAQDDERALLRAAFSRFPADALPPRLLFHLRTGLKHGAPSSWVVDWDIRVIRDEHGRPAVAFAGIDLSSRLVAEQHLRDTAALRASELRLRRLIESNVIGILFWDETGRITDANDAFLALLGFTRDELAAGTLSSSGLTPAEYRHLDDRALAEIRQCGRCTPFEKEYLARDGTRVPVLVGGARFDDHPHGALLRGVAFIVDLRETVRLRTARDQLLQKEQHARIETEVANARLLLLVEGSKRLARTMIASDTLDALASLVVPTLADWSYVAHQGWNGGPALVALAHADPNKVALLDRLRHCMPDAAAPEGAPRVFRTGEVALYDNITSEQLSASMPDWPIVGTRDPEALDTLRELGMKSLLCVPIRGRTGVDAVMMLVSAADPHRYGPEDVVLARDLADRAAVSLENGRLLAEALESVRARDDFLSVAAHELRTPLTSLLLQIQLMERAVAHEQPEVEAVRRGIASCEKHARRLTALVDSLLDVARLASHQPFMRLEEMDLRQVVDGVVAMLAADLQRAGCTVTVTMPAKVVGRWDRMRVEQVLTNLLSNAVKFGAGRPIEVSVDATETEVRIAVRDHGIGIPKEQQARIFGRFERAVSARHYGGLGLGLYISSHIVRALQGSIRVESEPGLGACFIVELPRALQPATADERTAAAP